MVKTGSTTTYTYGPDASRIRTTATDGTNPAETSYFIGSPELDPAGVLTKNPHPDVRIYGWGDPCFVHRNHLASVTLSWRPHASPELRSATPQGTRLVRAASASRHIDMRGATASSRLD